MFLFERAKKLIRFSLSLKKGTDARGTIDGICDSVSLRGSNVWMLICSSLLASIGLDLNSTAVIIGAMLISPLMSPILGLGLGVAILDRKLLKDSVTNLALATFLSLLTSFIYFYISPLGELTPELAARTTPTILDVGVAFFGGVAGIVANSRKVKTSAIPGVAIATALMPPICTAGFGLAHFSSTVFLGSIYLYFINAFFIALATYLMALWLQFPKHEQLDSAQDANVKRLIVAFAIAIVIPSAFIFYNVLTKLRFESGVKNFVNTEIRKDDRQPLRWEVLNSTDPKTLKVFTVGSSINEQDKAALQQKLSTYAVGDLKLSIVQMNVSPKEFDRLTSNVESDLSDKVRLVQSIDEEREKEIDELRAEIAEVRDATDPKRIFIKDVKNLIPEIVDALWQPVEQPDANAPAKPPLLVIEFKKGVTDQAKKAARARIEQEARNRFPGVTIDIQEMTTADAAPEPGATPAPAATP